VNFLFIRDKAFSAVWAQFVHQLRSFFREMTEASPASFMAGSPLVDETARVSAIRQL
jgi:hypothetical protein